MIVAHEEVIKSLNPEGVKEYKNYTMNTNDIRDEIKNRLLEAVYTSGAARPKLETIAGKFRKEHVIPFCNAFSVEFVHDADGRRFQYYSLVNIDSTAQLDMCDSTAGGGLVLVTPPFAQKLRELLGVLELKLDPQGVTTFGDFVDAYDPLARERTPDVLKQVQRLRDIATDLYVEQDSFRERIGDIVYVLENPGNPRSSSSRKP